MTASLIGGLYQTLTMFFGGIPSVGATEVGFCLVPNATAAPITITSLSFAGPGGANFNNAVFGQLPVTVPSGQSVILSIGYTTPAGGGTQTGTLVCNTSSGSLPTVNLSGTSGANKIDAFPSVMFPPVKVGQSLPLAIFQIVNNSLTNNTLTALAMQTGTDFAISGGPALPLTLGAQASSSPFSIVFTPTTTGVRTDNLLTTNVNGVTQIPVSGTGTTLQSFDNLGPPTPAGALLMAFRGNTFPPVILFTQQNNLPAQLVNTDCEEAASGLKITDFGRPNNENEVLRVRLHYVDLGPATMFITLQTRRQDVTPAQLGTQLQTKTFNIGTAAADEWPRQVTVDFNITGELVQINIGRNAANGPVMIIDYSTEWVPKGEVLEGV
jgi:hypothetical protein